jgi:hypothetical protein
MAPATADSSRALTEREVETLRSLGRRAIVSAAVAGVLSGALIGGYEIFVHQRWLDDGLAFRDQLMITWHSA